MGLAILLAWLAPFLCSAPVLQSTEAGATSAEEFVQEHERRLASHSFFSKVLMERVDAPAPIALYVQRPQVETPDWRAKLIEAHLPWFQALESEFRKTIVEPLALQRRADIPLNVVCVLQSHGDWVNYVEAVKLTGHVGPGAYFERRSRWTTTFHAGGDTPLLKRRADILAEFTHALLHAHYRADVGEIRLPWLIEGLGGYLTSGIGVVPQSLTTRAPRKSALNAVVGLVHDAKLRDVYLMPVAELVAAADLSQIWTRLHRRAEGAKLAFDNGRVWSAWRGECELWMHYLLDAAGPARRKSMLDYLGYALSGQAVADTFAKSFKDIDLAALDREFYAWVLREHAKLTPGAPVDVAVVEQLFKKPAAAPVGGAPNAEAQASNEVPSDAFAALAPSRDDLVATHGVLLQRARRGELRAAREQLELLLERARGSAIERRVQRDAERVAALIELRDAHFAALVASGAKVSWSIGDAKLVARVTRFADETITFDANRLGLESLPVTQVAASEWLGGLSKELAGGPSGWARHFQSVLDSDERALRRLDKRDPKQSDLRDDFETWYPGVLRLGEAALRMQALADGGAPEDEASARACIDAVTAMQKDFGDLELVSARNESLRAIVGLASELTFSTPAALATLAGNVEALADGRVRWRMDFSDASHGAMFEEQPNVLAEYRSTLGDIESVAAASAEVVRGHWVLRGSSVWKLPLAFRGPITVRAQVRLGEDDFEGIAGFLLLAGHRGDGVYVAESLSGSLLAYDAENNLSISDWKARGFVVGAKYALELKIDREHIRGLVNGEQRAQLPASGLGDGNVLVLLHSPMRCEFDSFEVEAGVDEPSARALWRAHQLRAAGL